MGPRAGLDSAENLGPTGIRSPEHPARSESLYRLSYPGPRITCMAFIKRPVTVVKMGNIGEVPMTVKWAIQFVISSLYGI